MTPWIELYDILHAKAIEDGIFISNYNELGRLLMKVKDEESLALYLEFAHQCLEKNEENRFVLEDIIDNAQTKFYNDEITYPQLLEMRELRKLADIPLAIKLAKYLLSQGKEGEPNDL